jgi:dienelactone hydrolase
MRRSNCNGPGSRPSKVRRGRQAFVLLLAVLAAAWLTGGTVAQDGSGADVRVWPADAVYRAAALADDLAFPAAAESIEGLTSPRMALIRPAGTGPFPAIVLMHQCAGLNQAVLAWTRKAVAHGYAVLLADSLGPRGVKSVCYGPKAGVNFFRGARDALQAAEHLRRLSFVDKDRIALVGFSWGAMVGLLASSSHYAGALGAKAGFAAVASLYPGCFRISPESRPPFDLVNPDIERPLLVLMGEADTETPAWECLEKLAVVKKSGAPVDWHVYSGTTHCWDCRQLDGRSKTDVRGHRVEYRFRQDVTEDSERRIFEFLGRVMPQRS